MLTQSSILVVHRGIYLKLGSACLLHDWADGGVDNEEVGEAVDDILPKDDQHADQ